MKSFGEWFANPARREPEKKPDPAPVVEANPLQDLADTLEAQAAEIGLEVYLNLNAKCWSCGRYFGFQGRIGEYDPSMREHNVCGGSDRCLP